MSGLCGIVRFDNQPVSASDFDRLMRGLAHLGPDRTASCHRESAALGTLLMRVTREDALDAQPLQAADLSFVSDARIDNRAQVAQALSIAPATLAQMADSALVLSAYREWGADCVERLVGDFVFAAWHAETRTLVLARDHMGQRHVSYYAGPGFFAFATERRGLWALPYVPRHLSDETIARALMFGWNSGMKAGPAHGIDALPGGTVLTLTAAGNITTRRYWEPRADPTHENRDEAYYVRAYAEVLGEAVACRLRRATAPAGLFMGGGFDSSAISGLAGPVMQQQRRKLIAVSSVMPENYRGTIRHARKWVDMCRRHMPHLDVRYVTREGLNIFTGMERSFLATGSGHSPNRFANDAMFAEIAAAGARVVMDGHGGDYTLNPRDKKYLFRLLRAGRLHRFATEWRARRRFIGASHRQLFASAILPYLFPKATERRQRRSSGLSETGPTLPIAPELARQAIAQGAAPRGSDTTSKRDAILRTLRRQQNGPALAGSIAAAAHGLEFTQPFHDKRVVELALAIPEALYVKNGRERYLARLALKDVYPPEFQTRGSSNDDILPDFLAMAKSIEPQVLAEIDRMEKSGKLSKYFDFPRMRSMLTLRSIDQHASGNEYDTQQALLAFLIARYVEWFRAGNS